MNQRSEEIQKDCQILFERALKGKQVVCFGTDGLGQYGANHHAKTFTVSGIAVQIQWCRDLKPATSVIKIKLDGYDSSDCGHVITDKNFDISLAKLLSSERIDPGILKNARIQEQEKHCVVLNFDMVKLLDW